MILDADRRRVDLSIDEVDTGRREPEPESEGGDEEVITVTKTAQVSDRLSVQ